jgi:outer membrane immunogenic protein
MRAHRLTQAALLASTALAGPAWAQSGPPVLPVHSWDGPYVGLYAGALGFFDDGYDVWQDASIDSDAWGPAGGGTIGFNRQFGSIVLGIEGDIGTAGLGDFDTDAPSGVDARGSVDVDVLGTLRARAGLALDGTLIYLTGGLAFADLDERITVNDLGGIDYRRSDWVTGWTFGGGVEHAFSDHWSGKAEALYLDFGDDSDGSDPYVFRFDDSAVLARVGLNYGF